MADIAASFVGHTAGVTPRRPVWWSFFPEWLSHKPYVDSARKKIEEQYIANTITIRRIQ
jgi:hypothetical protein